MEGNSVLIRNARIVEPKKVTVGDLLIEDGRIAAIGPNLSAPAGCATIDADGLWALPGFIDLHCHGGRLFDATLGKYIVETDSFDGSDAGFESSMPGFLEMAARHGVTTMLIATFAAETEQIKHSLSRMAAYLQNQPSVVGRQSSEERPRTVDDRRPSFAKASEGRRTTDDAKAPSPNPQSAIRNPQFPHVLGFFIEGTFIKHPDYAGAQNATYFYAPSRELFDEMNAAAQGMIRYINIVPEHGEAGLDLMRYVTKKGVLVGAGHTECAAEEFARAIGYGLKTAIHFTNGPMGGSYKPFDGGGAIEAILSSNRVTAELICDGYHVNPAYALDTIKRKGCERIILVTDGMFLTEASGPAEGGQVGDFTLAGVKGRVSENGKYLQAPGKANTLYGSLLTMDVAFANVVSWLTAGLPGIWNKKHKALDLETAVVRASRMASANPAKLLRVHRETGGIEVGKQADILLGVLEGEPGSYALRLHCTFLEGCSRSGE